MSDQCSERFFDAFDSNSGGCSHTCVCGRTHFDIGNDYSWEEGELENLEKLSKESPDKYIAHDCAIGFMEIDNIEIVYNCTCQYAKKYEQFLLDYERQIITYFRARAKALRERADQIDPDINEN
jgi:hypothetical protein